MCRRCSSAAPERARAEGLVVKFEVADAEALPFGDASFDAVLSTFGVMFATDHAMAASEMARARVRRCYIESLEPWRHDRGYRLPGEFVIVEATVQHARAAASP